VSKYSEAQLAGLLQEVRACSACESQLVNGVNPVVQAASKARLLVIGQAPGTKVHSSGVPWDDASGDRLRTWLGMDKEHFYSDQVAIMPMGFCYPGKGKSGDLPPRNECAPKWHSPLLAQLPNIQLTLLIGQYAQRYYLTEVGNNLAETVRNFREYLPDYMPLPHPSPRNNIWLRKNPWFEKEVVPSLRDIIS